MWRTWAAILVLGSCACGDEPAGPRGMLVLVGGGTIPAAAFERMAAQAGREARVAIVPDASAEPEAAAESGKKRFVEGGFAHAATWRLAEGMKPLEGCGIVFLGGGDQVRLMEAIRAGPGVDALTRFHRDGGVIVGNSAGTAVLSTPMLTGEGDDSRADAGSVRTAEGVPVLDAIVDQHFLARRRFTRLLAAVLESKVRVGIGIDEGTAAIVTSGTELEVVGAGTVTVIDARAAETPATAPGAPLAARGMIVHLLRSGDRWSLKR